MTTKTRTQRPPRFFLLSDVRQDLVKVRFFDTDGKPAPEKKPLRVFIDPERLDELRVGLAFRAKDRKVVLTGRGSVETYLAAGYYSVLAHASRISFQALGAGSPVELPSCSSREPMEKPWVSFCTEQDGCIRADILTASDASRKWSGADLQLPRPAAIPSGTLSLRVRGRGSVTMYANIGCSAALAGVREVIVEKPQASYGIRIGEDGTGRTPPRAGTKSGAVVGILGDPNSGKSVFSRALDLALFSALPAGMESWIYDCDLASPTPDWFLSKHHGTKREKSRAVREALKAAWTPEEEKVCAELLAVLRTNLDLVIADMPGGRHPMEEDIRKGNAFRPLRIPTGTRAAMMRQCDAFVVICREDRSDEIFEGWRESLAEHGLADRIVARIDSTDPDGAVRFSGFSRDCDGVVHGCAFGLDRNKDAAEIGSALLLDAKPLLTRLVELVTLPRSQS